jgi:hypothetical protein
VKLNVQDARELLDEEVLVRCQDNKVVVSISSTVLKRTLLGKHATLTLGSTESSQYEFPVRDLQVRLVV